MPSKIPSVLETVNQFNEAFNRHDVESVMALMTDDCVFESTAPAPDGKRFSGSAAVKEYWKEFFARSTDAFFEVEEIFTAGDRCVVRWLYRKSKDGVPWHLRGIDVFRVRDGQVSEKLSYVKG